jgi:hypothetical protein
MKKINLNKQFRDITGARIAGETYADAIAKGLYFGRGISVTNGEEKYAAYKLSTRIIAEKTEIELTDDETALVRKVAAAVLTPGAYGQVIDLLEK